MCYRGFPASNEAYWYVSKVAVRASRTLEETLSQVLTDTPKRPFKVQSLDFGEDAGTLVWRFVGGSLRRQHNATANIKIPRL